MAERFDLVDLRLVVNIAEANSLSGGAECSHLSVPAASNRVKNLEDGLGTKLFYRTSQGVTLTPPGQALVHHARLVLRQLEHLHGDLQEYTQGLKGHVRLFANTTAITEFLPAVLRKFLTSHPDINVDLRERLSHDIVHAVSDGTADIGIIAGNVCTDGLEVVPYRKDRLVLVTALDHPLARCETVGFDQTLENDYVALPEACAMHSFLRQLAQRLRKPLRIRIHAGNFEAVCRMVETNIGIGVVPERAARRYALTMAIHICHLSDEWALRDLKICMRSANQLPVFAKTLVDLMVADVAMAMAEQS